MSKKIASGADFIFIDVKVGNGALMKSLDEAKMLSQTMINIGKHFNKEVICILTDMDEPLGLAIGNSLEVQEAIDTLHGYGPVDVMELIVNIAALIVKRIKKIDIEEAKALCLKQLNNGNAYHKFEELVEAQHGNLKDMNNSF